MAPPAQPPQSLFPKLQHMGDEEEDRSEQLPSVEEAKMMSRTSLGSSTSRASSTVNDDSSVFSFKHTETERTAEDHDDKELGIQQHDQLPSYEEAKLYHARNSTTSNTSRKVKMICGGLLVLLLVGIVTAMVVVFMPMDEDEEMMFGNNEAMNNKNQDTTQPPFVAVTSSPTSAFSSEEVPAQSPTAPPPPTVPMDRLQQLVALLSNGISSMEDLQTEGTAQQRAAEWVANQDLMQMNLGVENTSAVVQRYVLAVMYFSLSGPNWRDSLNFMSAADVCQWNVKGKASDQQTQVTFGVGCNTAGMIQWLHVPTQFLTGSFPVEMQHLTEMETIDLFNNPGLTGGFPSFLVGLQKLKTLLLHYCEMQGMLPEWIGTLRALETLALSNNVFSGPIPDSFASLSNLESAYLDDNQLVGDIAVFGNLPSLKQLVIEDNLLDGQLTDEMFLNLPALEVFDASNNPIVSNIPASLFTLQNLRVLDLHNCNLYGPIPSLNDPAYQNSALEVLSLAGNKLDGEIPIDIGQYQALRQLDLSNNRLSSTIPATLSNLSNLQYLFLALNPFTPGDIPGFISSMTNLQDLSLKETRRTGKIPFSIGGLVNLKLLDLDSNNLDGGLPTSIGRLTDLEYLLVNRNRLSGTIPAEMELLSKLGFLMLDKNEFIGNADTVCSMPMPPKTFVADCKGPQAEIDCRCCSTCCADSEDSCNDRVWLDEINPIWELGYVDSGRSFDGLDQVYTVVFNGDIP